MLEGLEQFFFSPDFVPHGYCIGWWTPLVSTFVVSDLLTFLAYFSMPIGLIYFSRHRKDFPFPWFLWMSAAFILACGSTHLLDVIVLWRPVYGLSALTKAATAVISVVTATALWPLIPKALTLPSPALLQQMNADLQREIAHRQGIEEALRQAKETAESGLMRERQWKAAIVDGSEDAIIGVSLSGFITSWNLGATKMLGHTADQIIGQPVTVLIPEDRNNETLELMDAIRRGEARQQVESEHLHRNGSHVQTSLSATPIRNETGDIIGISGILRDVGVRKAAELKIAQMNATLERQVAERTAELLAANHELEAFAYAVSHDLRAPLRAMSGFSEILEQDYGKDLTGEARDCIVHIAQASHSMGQLIDGLLALSRITRGELVRQPVDLSRVARDLKVELEQAEPDRHVRWDIEPDLVVVGDDRMLASVMRNLLGNAWKYTASAADPEIRVFSRAIDGGREVCIADNGAGFDMAFAEQLFLPFRRLHRQDEFPGLGIGLATVQRIIHRHGGTVQGTAKPGQGALFSFSIPNSSAMVTAS